MNEVKTKPRRLSEIALEIEFDWNSRGKGVNFAAKPYLDAMLQLETLNDHHFLDLARSIVSYFLSNAATWRGIVARELKLELRQMLSRKGQT